MMGGRNEAGRALGDLWMYDTANGRYSEQRGAMKVVQYI